jgi:hypothetical protein
MLAHTGHHAPGSHPGVPPDSPNDRGGVIDIQDRDGKSLVEEASEESFPASDPTSFTPAGYIDRPPAPRKAQPTP